MANNPLLAAAHVSSASAKLERGTEQGGREGHSQGQEGGSEEPGRPQKHLQQDILEHGSQNTHQTHAAKAIGALRVPHKHQLQDLTSSQGLNMDLESLAQDLGAPQETIVHSPGGT